MKNKEVWERLKKIAAREGSNLSEKDIDSAGSGRFQFARNLESLTSALKELFAEEDQVLRRSLVLQQNTASTLHDKMKSEVSPSCPFLRRACLLLLG
ncbi:hypothetical protein G5714_007792 [Onychostoma macrolepis]|uniref:Uncharacterized protein n=1 Tax=Onychostoma macrolepis TaxID=369639 RepID=A0A7J6CUF5_9TELE|nr:hypothetical protein G5714_007792 [Onychostoma macrolepis]